MVSHLNSPFSVQANGAGHTMKWSKAINARSCSAMLRKSRLCMSMMNELITRLELYFSDKRNFLIVFRDQRERQTVVQKLASKDEHKDAISRSVIGNFVLDQVARATDQATERLMAMTRKWQNREISNVSLDHSAVETEADPPVCVPSIAQSACQ